MKLGSVPVNLRDAVRAQGCLLSGEWDGPYRGASSKAISMLVCAAMDARLEAC
jgi:hypothetical protein